ncbi:unnamed protein product, partial [Ectocarpus sp. 12 AP-2014]
PSSSGSDSAGPHLRARRIGTAEPMASTCQAPCQRWYHPAVADVPWTAKQVSPAAKPATPSPSCRQSSSPRLTATRLRERRRRNIRPSRVDGGGGGGGGGNSL